MRTTSLLLVLLCGVIFPVVAENLRSENAYVDDNADTSIYSRNMIIAAASGSTASVNIGGIASNAKIQGIAVINGRVYIDGKEIPSTVTSYRSPRTGEVYTISRKMGSVSVTSATKVKK
jgi:hypothetical protein